jgi:4-diphosphocytidyl-2-C-methyl-D-erythritol kinase
VTAAVTGASLTETAYAKINLALHVRRRRQDGYHALETLFAFADFGDGLSAAPSAHLTLSLSGPFAAGLDAGPDNLVLRAAQALANAAGVAAAAALHLDKRLPVASGIGGGSADAAAALRLLNRLWDLDWPADRLAHLGRTIGADVPACVRSATQLGEGVGEQLTDVAIDGAAGCPVLLVNPGLAVSTATVFRAWDGVDRGALGTVATLAELAGARNDLEAAACSLCPEIADVTTMLGSQPGTRLVRMSGSGATCFALFRDAESCAAASAAVGRARPDWWRASGQLR